MRIYRPKDVLQFWEETYGVLKPIWKPLFLNHGAMKKILKYNSDKGATKTDIIEAIIEAIPPTSPHAFKIPYVYL